MFMMMYCSNNLTCQILVGYGRIREEDEDSDDDGSDDEIDESLVCHAFKSNKPFYLWLKSAQYNTSAS